MTDTTRRHFALMSALGLGGIAACKAPAETAATPESQISAAENLLGVTFTDTERTQMAEGLTGSLDGLRALRDFDKPNTLAPASTFDPRIPGVDYGITSTPTDRFYGGDVLADTSDAAALERRKEALGIDGATPTDSMGLPPVPSASRPATDTDLAFAPASTHRALLDAGTITSVQLTQLYLDRIADHAPTLENFITVTAELALTQARAADTRLKAGETGGVLGLPYAAKDLFDTAGIKTTYGAEPFKDRVATDNAWVVQRLADDGAVLLGKTTLGALAYGDIWFGGRTNNPWNVNEGSSGSSAGSASAVAAGLCSFALGTETLGSLVSPSTRCGTASLRPTFGTVPKSGAMALVWSMDKIGPITRSIADAHLVMPSITGSTPADPSSLGSSYPARPLTRRRRIGVDPAWFEGADGGQLRALEKLREIADVVEITNAVPDDLPLGALSNILVAEAASAFEMLTLDGRDDTLSWQDDAAWPNTFRAGRFITAIDLVQSDRIRRLAMQHMQRTFADVDALFSPPFAGGLLQVTNYTGQPCCTIRAGFSDQPTRTLFGNAQTDGATDAFRVPNSTVLWGPLFSDAQLVQIAAELESALGVAQETPAQFS